MKSMAFTISLKRATEDDDVLFPGETHAHDSCTETREEEGRLAIDVYDGGAELVLISAIAGVRPEHLEVFLHNDMLTVRGKRTAESAPDAVALVRECRWGSFSRSIILPSAVDADAISATLQNGVLTVRMPKTERSARVAVREI